MGRGPRVEGRPYVRFIFRALAVGDEEAVAVLPEEGPDLFAIGAGQWQGVEFLAGGPAKGTFLVVGWQLGEARLDLKEKHQPMGFALITVLADEAGEVEIGGRELQAGLLTGLAEGTGVRAFACVSLQFAARRTKEAAVRIVPAFHQ